MEHAEHPESQVSGATSEHTLEYLMLNTELARRDPYLCWMTSNNATSATEADKKAFELEYPTHMCRQARLMYELRAKFFKDDYFAGWQGICSPYIDPTTDEYRTAEFRREFPCTWSDYSDEELIGTLVTEIDPKKPAMMWTYELLDESGQPVLRVDQFGKDIFISSKYKKLGAPITCRLNYSSKSIPKENTAIIFKCTTEPTVHAIMKVERNVDNGRVVWERINDAIAKNGTTFTYELQPTSAHSEKSKATLYELAKTETERDFSHGLKLETTVKMKNPYSEKMLIVTIAIKYLISRYDWYSGVLQRKSLFETNTEMETTIKYANAEHFGTLKNSVRNSAFEPTDKTLLMLVDDIYNRVPVTLNNAVKTIERMLNFHKTDGFIYGSRDGKHKTGYDMLVS